MLNLSWLQIRERVDNLPPILKEALFSYESSKKIRNTCRFYHLDDKKTSIVADLVGEVLMGFRPMDEFKKSLNEDLAVLGQTIINSLSERINKEIFQPIRSEIEENYSPVVAEIKRTEEAKEEKPKEQGKQREEENEEKIKEPEEKLTLANEKSDQGKSSPMRIETGKANFKKPASAQPIKKKKTEFKIKKEITDLKGGEPFIIFKRKRPEIKRKPLSFWFKQEVKKEKEPIKTEIEMAAGKEEKKEKENKKAEIKPEEKQTIEYQKPEEKKSPFKKN